MAELSLQPHRLSFCSLIPSLPALALCFPNLSQFGEMACSSSTGEWWSLALRDRDPHQTGTSHHHPAQHFCSPSGTGAHSSLSSGSTKIPEMEMTEPELVNSCGLQIWRACFHLYSQPGYFWRLWESFPFKPCHRWLLMAHKSVGNSEVGLSPRDWWKLFAPRLMCERGQVPAGRPSQPL